jgi:hypothetical protein
MRTVLLAASAALATAFAAQAEQKLDLNVYGDVIFNGYSLQAGPTPPAILPGKYLLQPDSNLQSRNFSLPRVATVISGRNGRLTLVSETTFTAPINQGTNTLLINVERFEIGYEFGDWLRLKAGRFHTAFGYYNDAYHTGFYYQLPIDRPAFVNYEDNGGLIPARAVGLHADGRIPVGTIGKLRWDAELLNNRPQKPTDTAILTDGGQIARAFNGRLRFEPGGLLDGLVIGGNFYYGHIRGSTDVVPLSDFNLGSSLQLPSQIRLNAQVQVQIPNYQEITLGAHIAYLENNVHFIAEYAHFAHQRDDGTVDVSEGGFIEAGYTFGDFTPFVLLDRTSLAHGNGQPAVPAYGLPAVVPDNDFTDKYFAYSIISQVFGSNWRYTAGVRWQPVDGLALKASVGRWEGDAGTSVTTAYGQAAVAF